MKIKNLCILACLVAILIFDKQCEGKKTVIHIPYKIKNIKHTHTVFKLIPHSHLSKREDSGVTEKEEFDHFKK
ncbi:hypothetical protein HCN44_001282 [Aphidius gifuensis]|uniref:Venom protein n=1 Tax=Aphidius gifuensis TaxID=684658 RepID=A0A835CLE5_APHGI|nr:hypothetical protein HCN44_001282 [Aphidius gifuensis]